MEGPDVVEVVLDAVRVDEGDRHGTAIVLRGVFPRRYPASHPPMEPGACRNVFQAFLGTKTNGRVFFIHDDPGGETGAPGAGGD